ncbi:MAG: methyltransferase domain-containing protein, partial [Holophagae bacterium]
DRPGFIGLDRFKVGGVNVIADMDAPYLPFGDNCFDLVLSVHSLEHVANLIGVMREIWRVAKPGSQVVVVAPYSTALLDDANPYHLQKFNEHSPRFWTDVQSSFVDPAEWVEPPLGKMWGLASSDNREPGLDLRCIRMEFLYFKEYWMMSPKKQRRYRKRRFNVCEQIMYHLVVFKSPMTDEDVVTAAESMELYVPDLIEQRRALRRTRG